MKKKIFISALMIMLLLCVCMLGGCSGNTATIDLKDYVSVSFTGYNGDGKANVKIDYEAMLPLIKGNDEFTAIAVTDNFEAAMVANNGKLSNGDTINVKINYSEQMMKNAKVNVKNPELTFSVSGLKDKEKLDVFAKVTFEVSGASPECTVAVKYNDKPSYGMFELKNELGENVKENSDGTFDGKFKNGEKLTVKIADKTLENLLAEYEISETSKEFTVQSDSKYILTASDFTDEIRKQLDKAAEDFLNEKINALLNDSDRAARINLLSAISGMNSGTLYAGGTWKMTIQPAKFNSAYVGVGDVSGSWGSTLKDQKSVYYFYDAEVSYYIKHFFDELEDTVNCALMVRIDDPKITPEGLIYSKMSFNSAKDFKAAYDSTITSKFEKLP